MILKGNQRGGGLDLGRHLMKSENDHVTVHEIRGFCARTVVGAFQEAYAVSRGTRCRQFLFSLSLNPPTLERVPNEAFEDAISKVEMKLGLEGQPRVIVFHEKEGRRHAHCVWSRIKADTMKAVNLSHTHLKLQDISRELYFEHEWKMPDGLIDTGLRNPLNLSLEEWQQARRNGQDPRVIKAIVKQCWAASDSGKAFRQALQSRGLYLARGDRRGVVALDTFGGVYSITRWAEASSKVVSGRLSDLAPLPDVEEVSRHVQGLVRAKVDDLSRGLGEVFSRASNTIAGRKAQMIAAQRLEREKLAEDIEKRRCLEAVARAKRFRTGLSGLWDRLTGAQRRTRLENEEDASRCLLRDRKEQHALIETHLSLRNDLQMELAMVKRQHTRSLARLLREGIETIDRKRLPDRVR